MKQILALNGSPKPKHSVSALLIRELEGFLGTDIPVYRPARLAGTAEGREALREIFSADALLLVFPLYVDALPAPLIRALEQLESFGQEGARVDDAKPTVYAVCNCGFYEPEHTFLALDIARNFAARAGLPWGRGIGIGSGGFLFAQKELAQGPSARVHAALRSFCGTVKDGGRDEPDIFVTPDIPRELYLSSGNEGWIRAAKKYGEDIDLLARPHI